MIVVGLDLSLTGTGICVLGPNLLYTKRFGSKVEGDDEAAEKKRIERIQLIAWKICEVCEKYKPEVIGVENYSFGSFSKSSSVTGLAELAGVVRVYLLARQGKVARRYAPTTARKIAFGKGSGKWKKDQVLSGLMDRGLMFPTNDEADAFVVAAATLIDITGDSAKSFWERRDWEKQDGTRTE